MADPVVTRNAVSPGPQSALDDSALLDTTVAGAPLSLAPVAIAAQPGDGVDAPAIASLRAGNANTGAQLNSLQRTESAGGEVNKPSFWHTLGEIIEFAARCFLPVINLISACIHIGRLIADVVSGKENIDWTRELLRIGGDLIGAIPGFGVVGAVANTGFNYWFDQHGGESRQGAQILGGLNYYVEGNDVQSSVGYYLNKATEGVRSMFSSGSQASADAARAGAPPADGVTALGPPPQVSASPLPDVRSGPVDAPIRTIDPNTAASLAPAVAPAGTPTVSAQPVPAGANLTGPTAQSATRARRGAFAVSGN